MSRRQIARELASGRIRRLHRGVYLVGPTLPRCAQEMAVVLACAPRAAISHRSAAHLWELPPHPAKPTPVAVTVAGRNPGRRPGIRIHRSISLRVSEVTTKHGIPVTTPSRTILDLAGELRVRELEQLVSEAFAVRLTNRPSLLRIVERHAHRSGVRALRVLLEAGHAPARTRSPPEERLLTLMRGAGLPEPEVNARLGPWEVDFLWRGQRVVVEVDGYASHSSPQAFERDRRKTAELQDAGFLVRRVTAKTVKEDAGSAVAAVARALMHPGA